MGCFVATLDRLFSKKSGKAVCGWGVTLFLEVVTGVLESGRFFKSTFGFFKALFEGWEIDGTICGMTSNALWYA